METATNAQKRSRRIGIGSKYLNGESEKFTLPYYLHEDTLYIAPAQSITPFAHYFP